jgi:hypothetical protein
MKTREAKRIARSVENGDAIYPGHVLRKVALQLGRPLNISVPNADLFYYPKGVQGEFAVATKYRPLIEKIVKVKDANPKDYDYFRELEVKPGQLVMNPHAGSDVEWACKKSCRLARTIGMVITFDFNDEPMTARPHSQPDALYARWHQEKDRKYREYLASDEYKEFLAEQEAERVEAQGKIDALLERLHTVTRGPEFRDDDQDALLDWMYEFSKVADLNTVVWDIPVVADRLTSAGWTANAHVLPDGLTKEQEENFRATIRSDKRIDAEYIIGQCVTCMLGGMPPHPVVTKFIDEYRNIVEKAA